MNRAARCHLLSYLDAASRPRWIVSLPAAPAPVNEAINRAMRSLGEWSSIVLPPSADIRIEGPRNAPRVVAGKGKRRRGVEREPLRLFKCAPQTMPVSFWHNRAA